MDDIKDIRCGDDSDFAKRLDEATTHDALKNMLLSSLMSMAEEGAGLGGDDTEGAAGKIVIAKKELVEKLRATADAIESSPSSFYGYSLVVLTKMTEEEKTENGGLGGAASSNMFFGSKPTLAACYVMIKDIGEAALEDVIHEVVMRMSASVLSDVENMDDVSRKMVLDMLTGAMNGADRDNLN